MSVTQGHLSRNPKRRCRSLTPSILIFTATLFLAVAPCLSTAEDAMEHQHNMQANDVSLGDQLNQLRARVVELESRIRAQGVDVEAMKLNGDRYRAHLLMGPGGNLIPSAAAAPAMNSAGGGNMMSGMMSMMSSMMGGMSGGGAMGAPAGMGSSGAISILPGFPGASHLYHVGSTNFFLDHPEHITLSLMQQSRLGQLRMQSMLRGSEFNRRIQESEEQLWLLTAADQPILTQIETKIREIEKLRGDLRLSVVKDVGEAAKLLSDEQRWALLGQTPPTKTQNIQAAPAGAMPQSGGMQMPPSGGTSPQSMGASQTPGVTTSGSAKSDM